MIFLALLFLPSNSVAQTIIGGSRTVCDSDQKPGQSVLIEGSSSTAAGWRWRVTNGYITSSSSTKPRIWAFLNDGMSTVTLTDLRNGGIETSTSAIITVNSPTVRPIVAITGGDRVFADTNRIAGELILLQATAVNTDIPTATKEWFVGGQVQSNQMNAYLQLPDGTTTITFRLTDTCGATTSTTANITINAPSAPIVAIIGGDRIISDTDSLAGEKVQLTATAFDPDGGTITKTEWLIDGNVQATGTSFNNFNKPFRDGTTQVTFRATDNSGATTSTSALITVIKPAPIVVSITGTTGVVVETDELHGEQVTLTATTTSLAGIKSAEWFVGTQRIAASGNNPIKNYVTQTLSLASGSNNVSVYATDANGNVSLSAINITVTFAPVVAVTGGSRSVSDTDGINGESVTLTAVATDRDGTIADIRLWAGDRFIGSRRATGTIIETISLPDGATTVTFRATDNSGATTSTTATITVTAPVINVVPVVAITGGSRTVADTNNTAGESVALTATATDSDGTIATTQWLVSGQVVATGTSATISLPDGATTVTFRATDNSGATTSTTATITVTAPVINSVPVVAITGGSRTIADTNSAAGESVALTATATDSDGTIASTQWLVAGQVVATGTSATISLSDGATTVIFRATDNTGATTSTSATITVAAPTTTTPANVAPTARINQSSLSPLFGDYFLKRIELTGVAEDTDGQVSKIEWQINGVVVSNEASLSVELLDQPLRVAFVVTDDDGAVSIDERVLIDTKNQILLVQHETANVEATSVRITNESLSFSDTDNRNGEWISLTALETMATGRTAASVEWYDESGTVFLGQGRTLTIQAPDGISEYSVKVIDDLGKSIEAFVLVIVEPKAILSGVALPDHIESAIRNVGSYNPASNEIHSCVVLRTRRGIFAGLFNVGSRLEVTEAGMFINVVRAPSPAPGETSLEELAKDCSGNFQLNAETGFSEYHDLYYLDGKLYRVTGQDVPTSPTLKVKISLTPVD
jgi:hypothetical protein